MAASSMLSPPFIHKNADGRGICPVRAEIFFIVSCRTLAHNPAAAENGRKLSKKGSFSAHRRTADNSLYWAECAGSGKNPYRVSIDFTNADAPTCRCSCPSRQFPCKHALGLMFELLAEKPFEAAEIPQDIAD